MKSTFEFMQAINHNGTDCIIRAIYEREDSSPKKAIPFRFKMEDYPKFEPRLKELNLKGYGIFFGVNGGVTDADVQVINAQFFESDTLSIEKQLENIRAFPLQPTIVIRTRKSLHVYFEVKDAAVSRYRGIQTRLADYFEGDHCVQNESRIMRLPYFYHCKQEPFWVDVIEYNPDAVYTQDEIFACLPEPDEEGEVTVFAPLRMTDYRKGTPAQLERLFQECDFMRFLRDCPAEAKEPLWRGGLGICICFEGGEEKGLEISQGHPEFNRDETIRKMELYRQSGAGPLRCDTIRSLGFDCPKMRDGGCGCKSPAALPWVLEDTNWEEEKEPWYDFPQGKKPILIADALAEELAVYLPSVYHGGVWHMYQNGVYMPVSDDYVKDLICGFLRDRHRHVRDINEVFELWRLKISRDESVQLNHRTKLINVKNGLYDTETGTLLEHDDRYLSTIQLNVDYLSYALCPTFLSFLENSLAPDVIPALQEFFGYALSCQTASEKCLLLYGKPRAGKSTLLNVLTAISAGRNCTHISLQNLEDKFKVAQLDKKLLNVFSDLPSKPLEDTGMLKALVSFEPVLVEHKGKTPFVMRSIAKMVFSVNQLPRYYDRSGAFERRLLIIPFERSVPLEEVDPYLLQKLLKEKQGIFNWAMQGLRRLVANRYVFTESTSSQEALEKYRRESDNVLLFIYDQLHTNTSGFLYCEELYKVYIDWCNKSGYDNSHVAKNRFNETISREFGDNIVKDLHPKTRRACWKGLSFKPSQMEDADRRIAEVLEDDTDLPY